ncbi:hypothetical protein GCM10011613_30840 [Cellvibrio zantedeschiae]|uniref:Uncharacterized protein n=1 Tax=Cellvibrio zantedeschiae TaxID=1237077 RepID=A0ABQ3B7W6_9GAMM|nr:hypothetical protein [Cellvibrio zantedeschiae]GGY83770.1 hypothetical protein GCM10011613_30840 [Cellvibrio zantedeschiae]
MIDIEARKKAAEVTRRFIAGQFSNFEFENCFPSSDDPALYAIEDTLWCFYDDFEEHTLKSIPEETKALMMRWLLFLYSNEEYKWPKISSPGVRPIKYNFLGRLLNRHNKQHEFLTSGEIEFWPFINNESFKSAIENPVLLATPMI